MNWFKQIFGSKNQIAVSVAGVNPQTKNEYRFYAFVESEPSIYLEGWYKKTKQLGYKFKPQYVEAIKEKINTGKFKNPYTFPEYFDSQFDFIAIDFETANYNRVSACAIGLAFVKDNTFVHTEKHYILPPRGEKFLKSHSRIHGIYKEDLEYAQNFEELWRSELCKYFNDNLIVFHNASMDLSVLKNLFDHYKIKNFNIDYIDTMKLAAVSGNPKKLVELAKVFNIDITNHHDPQADAEVCADIFSELIEQYPDYRKLKGNINSEKVNEEREATATNIQIQNENFDIISEYSISKEDINDIVIQDQGFLFTGQLIESREECKDFIIEQGGLIKSGISGKVDYVVLGTGYGWSKVQKIHELNSHKSCRIKILFNSDFQQLRERYS